MIILLRGGFTNLLLGLFFVELLSWLFILMVDKYLRFKYLIIQNIFLLLSLIGLIWRGALFFFAFLLKIGLPPFHLWFLNLVRVLKKITFLFLVTIHKLLPLFFLIKRLGRSFRLIIRTLIFTVRRILIIQARSLFFIITVSSIIHSGWLLRGSFLSMGFTFFYWRVYSRILVLFFFSFNFSSLKYLNSRQTTFTRIVWLILSGLPPFSIFWLKINILMVLLSIRKILRLFIILASVLRISSYYRAYHLSLSLMKRLSQKNVLFLGGLVFIGLY